MVFVIQSSVMSRCWRRNSTEAIHYVSKTVTPAKYGLGLHDQVAKTKRGFAEGLGGGFQAHENAMRVFIFTFCLFVFFRLGRGGGFRKPRKPPLDPPLETILAQRSADALAACVFHLFVPSARSWQ